MSGGQRQRIALARALAIEPRVLLLDEPFGALDAKVRKELRRWLRTLHEDIHVTSVFVTHDQEEALEVADRVVVMDRGRIEQVGAPADVHDRPASAFVHEFIGESVVVPVTVEDRKVKVQGRAIELDAQGAANGTARLFVRPYEIDVVPAANAALSGIIKRVHGLGAARRVEVQLSAPEALVEIDTPRNQVLSVGDTIGLKPQRYRIFADAR